MWRIAHFPQESAIRRAQYPAAAAAGRGYTKFVGRLREMEALKRAADQAKAGHGQIAAVMGEPGVGKSQGGRRLYRGLESDSNGNSARSSTLSVTP